MERYHDVQGVGRLQDILSKRIAVVKEAFENDATTSQKVIGFLFSNDGCDDTVISFLNANFRPKLIESFENLGGIDAEIIRIAERKNIRDIDLKNSQENQDLFNDIFNRLRKKTDIQK